MGCEVEPFEWRVGGLMGRNEREERVALVMVGWWDVGLDFSPAGMDLE